MMPPGTAMHGAPGTAMKSYVPGTAQRGPAGPAPDTARPMTSVRGAGFTSVPNRKFDPMNQGPSKGGASLMKKADVSVEEQAKDMEKKVHEILEQSALLTSKEEHAQGLEKAMEARKRERALTKFREGNNLGDQVNVDLTYAVDFNLAVCYHANKDYQEALDQFTGGWVVCASAVCLSSSGARPLYLLQNHLLSAFTLSSYCQEQGVHAERAIASEYGQHLL